MIQIPEKDTPQYEAMMNRLGPVTMEFILNLAREHNAHVESHTVVLNDTDEVTVSHTLEESDA